MDFIRDTGPPARPAVGSWRRRSEGGLPRLMDGGHAIGKDPLVIDGIFVRASEPLLPVGLAALFR